MAIGACSIIGLVGRPSPTQPILSTDLHATRNGGVFPTTTSPFDLLDDIAIADLAVHGAGPSLLPFTENGNVTMVFATEVQETPKVTRALREIGAEVQWQDESVGYVRAAVPAERAGEVHRLPGVMASQISRWRLTATFQDSPKLLDPKQATASVTPVAQDSALPLMPDAELRAMQAEFHETVGIDRLRRDHPTFDGRGVTVAIVEDTPSTVDHPAFSTALTLDGTLRPKIADIVPGEQDDADAVWHHVIARGTFEAKELLVRLDGQLAHVPRTGRFHWGRLQVQERHYFVLWDARTREVWVDTDQDLDLRNEKVLNDLRDKMSVGQLRHADPQPGSSFVVRLHDERPEVVVLMLHSRHATMTGSIATGSATAANLAVGVAPGARVMFFPTSGDLVHDGLEAIIRAARTPQVDVVSVSLILTRSLPDSAHDVAGIVMDRIVDVYRKPMFLPAANSGGLESPDAASGQRALVVGALLPAAIASRLYDVKMSAPVVWSYSDRGPRSDGRLRPDIAAPATGLAAWSCDRAPGERVPRFRLPACYSLSGGSSAATPMAAGLAAALLSGARQRGIDVDHTQLRRAILTSTAFADGSRAIDQGMGIPQADVAWQLLTERYMAPAFTLTASLRHALASYRGGHPALGLYEREDWWVGREDTRTLWITRTNGPSDVQTYDVELRGSDGTFSTTSRVTSELNRAVPLTVHIKALHAGVKSAILLLRERSRGRIVHEQLLTIAVADRFTARDHFRLDYTHEVPPFGRGEHVVEVPEGTDALLLRFHPSVPSYITVLEPGGWSFAHPSERPPTATLTKADQPGEVLIPDPRPGTWLIVIRTSPAYAGRARALSYRLSLDLVRAETSIRTLPGDQPKISVQSTNRGAQVAGSEPVVEVGIVHRQTVFLAGHQSPAVIDLTVAPSTAALILEATSGGSTCGTHLYVYNCASGTCLRFEVGVPAAPRHAMRIRAPQAGLWKLAVTPGPMCAAAMTTEVRETHIGPFAGTLHARRDERRGSKGEQWEVAYDLEAPSGTERDEHAVSVTTRWSDLKPWPIHAIPWFRPSQTGWSEPVGTVAPLR